MILLPLVNLASFEHKVPHVNPVDGKSMNRFYPGRADGTQTERAAWGSRNKSSMLRSPDRPARRRSRREPAPLRLLDEDRQREARRRCPEMVLAFGLDHIIIGSTGRRISPRRAISNTSTARGKPSIAAEAGHAGTVETDDVALLVNGALSTMRAPKNASGRIPAS